eukprot:31308-Pelagococcus_subviridis.AAC.8
MKYSSLSATFSSSIAIVKSGSVIFRCDRSVWHMFRINAARGSTFLYSLCPNPIRRNGSDLSFARFTHDGMFSTLPISSSISSTASFAPPCAGPHSDATPAATHANGFACEECRGEVERRQKRRTAFTTPTRSYGDQCKEIAPETTPRFSPCSCSRSARGPRAALESPPSTSPRSDPARTAASGARTSCT